MLHKFRPAIINIQYVHHILTIISLEIKNVIKYSMMYMDILIRIERHP